MSLVPPLVGVAEVGKCFRLTRVMLDVNITSVDINAARVTAVVEVGKSLCVAGVFADSYCPLNSNTFAVGIGIGIIVGIIVGIGIGIRIIVGIGIGIGIGIIIIVGIGIGIGIGLGIGIIIIVGIGIGIGITTIRRRRPLWAITLRLFRVPAQRIQET
ncbi:hypothetical protein ACE6H2_001146 [Prunus campanulata]